MPNVYEIVTEQLVKTIEEEKTLPWERPWNFSPRSYGTKKEYSGINRLLLSTPHESRYWLTFNEAKRRGGYIREGEHGSLCVFWTSYTPQAKEENTQEEGEERKEKSRGVLRYYRVWNLDQTGGIERPKEENNGHTEKIREAEEIVSAMPRKPIVREGGDRAYYSPLEDTVTLPPSISFKDAPSRYGTLFHELVHSTGHGSRLNRNLTGYKGTEEYSQEELVAEIGACFLLSKSGLVPDYQHSGDYLRGWATFLRDHSRAIVTASSQAEKATKYIMGETTQEEEE